APTDMYRYFSSRGVSGASIWKLVKGGACNWWDGIIGDDPEKFTQSFAPVLLAAAAVAAPAAEVGAAGEAGVAAEAAEASSAATGAAVEGDATGLTTIIGNREFCAQFLDAEGNSL